MTSRSKAKRIQPVVRVAVSRQDQAAQALARAQGTLDGHRRQLDELLQYRTEYAQRFCSAGAGGMSVAQMQEFRRFLSQLDTTIVQQQQVIARASQECELRKRQWQITRGKTKTVQTLQSRYEEQERQALDRLEQREADDRAATLFRLRVIDEA